MTAWMAFFSGGLRKTIRCDLVATMRLAVAFIKMTLYLLDK